MVPMSRHFDVPYYRVPILFNPYNSQKEKENSEFKPVKLHLKIDLVSYPAQAEGLGKYDNSQKHTKYFNK